MRDDRRPGEEASSGARGRREGPSGGRPRRGVRVRGYSPRDREACLAVFDSNVPAYFATSERAAFDAFLRRPPGSYLVLENRDREVVACGGYALRPGSSVADLCWGMVRRQDHGSGLGRRLAEERIRAIRDEGAARIVTLRTSQCTRGFYERLGFSTVRVDPDGFAPGIDRCEMRLELDRSP